MKIKVCECCGDIYEQDDALEDLQVCGECNFYDEALIGIIDLEDKND
jgi:hypothetical protein